MVHTFIKSIASELAFGIMSVRFAGIIYQRTTIYNSVRLKKKEEKGFH